MSFQEESNTIRWRLHLHSPVEKVYQVLSTDAGCAGFWAESAVEKDGVIHFVFPSGATWDGQIVFAEPPITFSVTYYCNTETTFHLERGGDGGTDLTLTDTSVPAEDRSEVIAGWVSVLMALKAYVDFGVDLHNHDPARHWDRGFVDN